MIMKRTKFLLILTILFLVIIFFYYIREIVITALMSLLQTTMSATIAGIPNVSLTLEVDKDIYCPGEIVNLTNTIENIGDRTTGNLFNVIRNPSSSIVNTTFWNDIILNMGQKKVYNSYYTVPSDPTTGTYTAEGNFTYDGKVEYATDNFQIFSGIGTLLYTPPDKIEVTIESGSFNDDNQMEFWLVQSCENTFVIMNKSTGIPGDWVNFTNERVYTTTQPNSTIVNISVPLGVMNKTYTGYIYFYPEGGSQHSIDLIVHVTGLVFTMNVIAVPKTVCIGNTVSGIVNAEKNQEGPLDVNMTYRIVNITNVIAETNRSLHFDNMTAQDIQTFDIPASLAEGIYTFTAILQYNQTQTQSSDTFQVIKCIPTTSIPPSPAAAPAPLPIPTYGLSLRLSKNLLTVITGNKTSFIAFVNNTGTDTVESVKILTEGIPINWIETIPAMNDISPGQTKEYLVVITIPSNAEPGVYRLNVTATDSVESNKETLLLFIGRNPKEIADLLLSEIENVRIIANQSLLVEECIDISLIKSMYQDAEIARENGMKEYQSKNYVSAINWFEYAILNYQQVIYRVEIAVQLEISATKKSGFLTPPGTNIEDQLNQAQKYLNEKNYAKICEYLVNTRTLMMYGFIFWPLLIIIPIVLLIIFVIIYRRHREMERDKTLVEIKGRLDKFNEPKTTHIYPKYITFDKIKKLMTRRTEDEKNQSQ